MIQIDKNNCDTCGTCISICPENAIALVDSLIINHEICSTCQQCVDVCPFGALRMSDKKYRETTVNEE